MLANLPLDKILFLDIETVSQQRTYSDVPERMRSLWDKKAGYIRKNEEETPEECYKRAAIYAEFGKIVCISTGYFNGNTFRIKSFYGDDEKIVLLEFADMLNSYFNTPVHRLCGHNSREFDIPYIARRMLVNGIKLPKIINITGKKPWEVNHLDTMELWKFGDWKSYTSLNLLAAIFDIPTPKDDIDGSQVGEVYWEENDLERIATYCEKDALTVAQLLLRYLGEPLIHEANIIISK